MFDKAAINMLKTMWTKCSMLGLENGLCYELCDLSFDDYMNKKRYFREEDI